MERERTAERPFQQTSPGEGPSRERLRRLAWFLDSSIRVPGVDRRIGADAVIGLVPGIGDAFGAVFSSYILLEAVRMGASTPVVFKMMINVAAEVIIGAIPLLGDLFDMAWKANERNVELLENYLDSPQETTAAAVDSSRRLGLVLVGVLVLAMLGLIALGVLVVRWLWMALA